MLTRRFPLLWLYVAAALAVASPVRADEARSLDELRNTVIILLDALVQKGVMTKEQAQQMVATAQAQAEREAKERAAANADTEGAVRVTYVPQVVKDEISAQVSEQVRPQVVKDVVAQAQSEQWGVPAALPVWIKDLEIYGDVRVRQQYDGFASDNAEFAYLDFLKVNQRGGIGKAGNAAFLNTTEDRMRTRIRARLGFDVALGDGFSTGLRLSTGNFTDPVSTNQTLAQTSGRYTFGVEQAYLRYDATKDVDWSWLSLTGGRMANPFHSTDLVFDNDLTFEGFAGTYRHALTSGKRADHHLFATLGAFPLEEVELSSDDKWLYAAQFGGVWRTDGGLRFKGSLSYYHYDNVVGVRNAFESTLTDFTAPVFLQKGNTLFDIRNDADPSTNLFALAADYHVADVLLGFDLPAFDDYQLSFNAEYVTNLGFDRDEVLARTGIAVEGRTDGYMIEVGFGHPKLDRLHAWRAAMRYRYLQRDAVLDAFTDSDFHLGGTDAQGYVLRGDYGLGRNVYLSFRYLSANEIDGPPLGIDVVQLDLNGQF